MNKIANRKVICDVLMEHAKTDRDIVVLCSDSRGSASLTPFFDTYPEQSVRSPMRPPLRASCPRDPMSRPRSTAPTPIRT